MQNRFTDENKVFDVGRLVKPSATARHQILIHLQVGS